MLLALGVVVTSASAGSGQTPTRGGTAVLGTPAFTEPPCFNPFILACQRGMGAWIMEDLVFARPFSTGPGRGTFRPDLVSGVTVTKKPFTVTYHIRPEARWSDGRPVTAFDWQFSHGAAMRSETARANLPNDSWLRKVTRWRALDAKTFRMWVSEPVSLPEVKEPLPFGLLPRHVISTADLSSPDFWRNTIADPKTGRPIGSGPFLMQSFRRGQSITLVRNPRYWGPHPAYLDKFVVRFLPYDELADALRRGEIDLLLHGLENAAVQEISRSRPPGVRVDAAPDIRLETLMIRVGAGGHPALKKKQVRQALAYGIDRAGLLRTLGRRVFGRKAQPVAPPESLVNLSQYPAYEPNWQRYHYRRALARRLLARSGCRPGNDGIRVCDGERLSLRIGTTAGVESRQQTLEFLQTNLRAIGVELKPLYFTAPGSPWDAIADGDLDLAVWTWVHDDGGEGSGEEFLCNGSLNYTGFCSRLVNRELENADRVITDDARHAALNRADRLLANAVPAVPLYQRTAEIAHRTTLHIPNLDPVDAAWNMADWWIAESP